jgi:NAD(P)-dependent dehydrogenase (short-subunit alcohol dehydrogenase family)
VATSKVNIRKTFHLTQDVILYMVINPEKQGQIIRINSIEEQQAIIDKNIKIVDFIKKKCQEQKATELSQLYERLAEDR